MSAKNLVNTSFDKFEINKNDYAEYLTDDIRHLWLRMHANLHLYNRMWLGVPVKQHPSDMITMQEMIFKIKPKWIIETGVKFGGGCLFYSSILEMIGQGKVIGVDIELLPDTKKVLEHPNGKRIYDLFEHDSTAPEWIAQLKNIIKADDPIIVILDSSHTKEHVLKELEIYSELVTVGSYLLCCDASWKYCADSPIAGNDWDWNNPHAAIMQFVETNNSYVIDRDLNWHKETYFHDGYLKKIK
jgi:cephalosporin hydroxylase